MSLQEIFYLQRNKHLKIEVLINAYLPKRRIILMEKKIYIITSGMQNYLEKHSAKSILENLLAI